MIKWIRTFVYRYVRYVPILNRLVNWKFLVYACETKVKYNHAESAMKAAARMNAKPGTRNELEYYPCKFCDGFHVGRVDTYRKRKREGRLDEQKEGRNFA